MNDYRSKRLPSVLRVQGPQGPTRPVRAEVRQTQWLRALFAYAELHADPSFEVRQELEGVRTVPAVRWGCHRDLLEAHVALTSQLPRTKLTTFRAAALELVRSGASYDQVETELGEFQALDAAHILSNCPFLWRTELGSTYWSSDEPGASRDEPPSDAPIQLYLGACRSLTVPRPDASRPVCISVCAHAPAELLSSDRICVAATDLAFDATVHPLEEAHDACAYFVAPDEPLIERLSLVDGRAAWAVALKFEEHLRSPEDAQAALGAALELVRALSVSSETRVPSWQGGAGPRVMAVADFVRDTAIAVLAAFECIQRCLFHERVPPSRDRFLFDSKHFRAASAEAINKTLSISGSRYSVSLEVELADGRLEESVPPANDVLRLSTVRLRGRGRRGAASKRSV